MRAAARVLCCGVASETAPRYCRRCSTKQLMSYYYMLLASLESNSDTYSSQMHLLDDLIDLTAPAEDAE